MTAADRPSVTDAARAEAHERYADLEGVHQSITASHRDAFMAGARWAAGRAETTTATTEDAETAIWHDLLDTWGTSASGRRTMSPATARGITRHVINALNERGLLATARTRPTREQVIDLLREHDTENHGGQDAAAWYYEAQADAVLALLEGGGDR